MVHSAILMTNTTHTTLHHMYSINRLDCVYFPLYRDQMTKGWTSYSNVVLLRLYELLKKKKYYFNYTGTYFTVFTVKLVAVKCSLHRCKLTPYTSYCGKNEKKIEQLTSC